MNKLPYPSVTGGNPQEQVAQLRAYLYQLVDQLNYLLEQIEKNQKKEA